MATEQIIRVRGLDGTVTELDEYNMTATRQGHKVDARPVEMRDLTIANVHQAAAMSGFVTGYGSQVPAAIADIVAPPYLVTKDNDKYYTYSVNNTFRRVATEIASEQAEINEIGPTLSTDTYQTAAHGIGSFVSQGVIANADPGIDPRIAALGRCMNAMVMEREHRAATALLNSSTFSGYTATLTSSNYWEAGATSSDPVKDLITGEETMLKEPTHIAMSAKSWNRFITNPQVIKYSLYKSGTSTLPNNPTEVASILGLPYQFVIGRMKSESTTSGTTTISYVWDDDVVMLHIPPGAGSDGESVPTARTFRWLKDGMARETGGFRIREWDVPGRGQDGGRKIAVVCNEIIKVVAAPVGYVLINVW